MAAIHTVEQVSEPLVHFALRHSNLSQECSRQLLSMLLGESADRAAPRLGTCGLNSNGIPLQLCISSRRGGAALVLIGDPWADLENQWARQSKSESSTWKLLAYTGSEVLSSGVRATLRNMLPASPAELGARRMGLLWLAASVEGRSFSLYACPSWDGSVAAGWQRVERWINEVLPDQGPARRIVARIRDFASPEGVCIEGAASSAGRAKIYFRLRGAVTRDALRILHLGCAEVAIFLEQAVGERTLRPHTVIFGVSFLLDTGAFNDAKLDLCAHCIQRPSQQWRDVLHSVGEWLAIDTTCASAMLAENGVELACIGIGRDMLGAFRLNAYGRPVLGTPSIQRIVDPPANSVNP